MTGNMRRDIEVADGQEDHVGDFIYTAMDSKSFAFRRSEKINKWLDELGLSRYAEQFANQEVVFEDLVELNEDDFKELGIPLGPRKRKYTDQGTISSLT